MSYVGLARLVDVSYSMTVQMMMGVTHWLEMGMSVFPAQFTTTLMPYCMLFVTSESHSATYCRSKQSIEHTTYDHCHCGHVVSETETTNSQGQTFKLGMCGCLLYSRYIIVIPQGDSTLLMTQAPNWTVSLFPVCLWVCVCVETRGTKTALSAWKSLLLPLEMLLSFYVQRHLLVTARLFQNCEEGTGGCEGM